ncbi:tyrosine-type recombinase/integrase [Scytonema sp. PCC 10023]|uniref:tyrosine-type recombinase/integrase n=1 Tax=Scytonema sp. PCC 10023 TaxID=1680591 RepID=UPI0039C5B36B
MPVTPVRRKNKDYRSREYLTAGEINRLLLTAKVYGRYRERNEALVLMMFRHALRVTEACEMRWDAISLLDKEIFITRKKGSDNGVHPLPIDEVEALTKLRQLNPKNPYVFVGERGEPLTPAAVQRLLTRLGAAAGLNIKVHPHQLRHACGYYLVNAGYSTRFIQDFLGHRDIRHTERYTKLNSRRFVTIDWNRKED